MERRFADLGRLFFSSTRDALKYSYPCVLAVKISGNHHEGTTYPEGAFIMIGMRIRKQATTYGVSGKYS